MNENGTAQINPEVNYFGETNYRNRCVKFGIKLDDRRRHMYVIGKTGMGKTVLLENMVIQDVRNGFGCAYVDPHGDTAETLLQYIPPERINDVVYFNPSDLEYPIAFNILEAVAFEHRHLVASALMGVFTKIWADVWSSRMEYILNNTILSLLEVPGNTLLGVMRMYADKEFRKKIVSRLRDPLVKAFWVNEYANWNERYRQEAISAIQNKVGQFLSSSIVRNIVGQTKSTINMRDIMDSGKILIMNLAKGRIGEDASALLGGMVITRLQTAAMSRVDIPREEDRRDFFLYVDEFQNFSTKSFADTLSEARKYRLSLILAHQYIAQLSEEVRDSVFGNVGTIVTMRIGVQDAEYLVKEYEPTFTTEDLVNLPKWKVFLKLMIDGNASQPFSANTLPPMKEGVHFPENAAKVVDVSRERYTRPAAEVEDKIIRWMGHDEDAEYVEAGDKQKKEKEPNAVCDNCKKQLYIPFTPDDKRNVFCKDCLTKFKNGEIDTANLAKLNVPKSNGVTATAKAESSSAPAPPPVEQRSELAKSEPVSVAKPQSPEQPAAAKSKQAPVKASASPATNAVCDNCRKGVHISFTPDDKRNVFCKDCLPKFKRGEIDIRNLPKLNISPEATDPAQSAAVSVSPEISAQPKVEPVQEISLAQATKLSPSTFGAQSIGDIAGGQAQPASPPSQGEPLNPGQVVKINK